MTGEERRVPPEFARPVDTAHLPVERETAFDLVATQEERAALTHRFGLVSLGRLEAAVRLKRLAGGLIRLSAVLSAEVVQSCVVTLDPLPARVEESFSLVYGAGGGAEGEVVLDGEEALVEPLSGSSIDIGEAVAQQLSLALDSYPRAPGAAISEAPPREVEKPSPFAALAKWPKKG